jgi:hypothetical protein
MSTVNPAESVMTPETIRRYSHVAVGPSIGSQNISMYGSFTAKPFSSTMGSTHGTILKVAVVVG